MKTLKSKISTILNKVSKNILGNPAAIRNLIKPIFIKILNIITFEKGYKVKIIASNEGPDAKFSEHGYKADIIFPTDGKVRGLYYNISNDDAIKFICDIGGVRAVFLECKK